MMGQAGWRESSGETEQEQARQGSEPCIQRMGQKPVKKWLGMVACTFNPSTL